MQATVVGPPNILIARKLGLRVLADPETLSIPVQGVAIAATETCAPQAAILYDKFHVIRHLGEALDQVRKSEYGRLARQDRGFGRT